MGVIDRWRKSPRSESLATSTPHDLGGDTGGSMVPAAAEDMVCSAPDAGGQLPTEADIPSRVPVHDQLQGSPVADTVAMAASVKTADTSIKAVTDAAAVVRSTGPVAVPSPAMDNHNAAYQSAALGAEFSAGDGAPEAIADDGASALSGDGERLLEQPLVIQADAPLVDGLRALLVHHLKRSVGSNIVSLSTSQAELLEHHLARLSSYAQKIVHTLAFATRFLSKHQFEGGSEGGELDGPDAANLAANRNAAPMGVAPAYGAHMSGAADTAAASAASATAVAQAARPPRKSLKLNDDEILTLYRSAQVEAAIEADWRGIQGPTPSRACTGASEGTYSSRSGASGAPSPGPGGDAQMEGTTSSSRADYLRILSRAMQEPGRSPRAVAAEIVDPSKKTVCCGRTPTVLDNVMGGTSARPPPLAEAPAGRVGARSH